MPPYRRTRRRELHQRVGEALEQQYAGDFEPHLSELAYHFAQCRRPRIRDKAIEYSRRAGEQALTTYAYEEGVRHFETALSLSVGPEDRGLRCALLLRLAEALMPSGGTLRVAQGVAPEAAGLAESLGNREQLLQACRVGLLALRRYASTSSHLMPDYRGWLDRAQRVAEPGSVDSLWLDVNRQFLRGSDGYTAETWDTRLDNLRRARELGDPDLLCRAAASVLAVAPPRHWSEQVAMARELASPRWQGANADEQSAFDTYCAAELLDGGDRQGWGKLHEQMRFRGEQLRDPHILFWGFFAEHGQLLLDGHLLGALQVQERMLEQTRRAGMEAFGLSIAVGPGGRNLLYLGRAEEGLALVEELGRVAGRTADPVTELGVLCRAYLVRREEVNAALDLLLRPEGALAQRGIVAIVQFLEAAVLVKHFDAVAALAELLAPAAEAATCRVAYTCAARHLAAASALTGDNERAFAYARQALEVSTRIQNRPEIALIRLQLAELLLNPSNAGRQPAPDARAEARSHLDFAVAEFAEMKMQRSLEHAAELHRRLLPNANSPTEDSTR